MRYGLSRIVNDRSASEVVNSVFTFFKPSHECDGWKEQQIPQKIVSQNVV